MITRAVFSIAQVALSAPSHLSIASKGPKVDLSEKYVAGLQDDFGMDDDPYGFFAREKTLEELADQDACNFVLLQV